MEYTVEKIVWRKLDPANGKMYYRIKWEGYSSRKNTTEIEDNCANCTDTIDDFERNKITSIIGFKKCENGQVFYLMKWRDIRNTLVSSEKVRRIWPHCLINFLESKIVFRHTRQGEAPIQNESLAGPRGEPVRIIYATVVGGRPLTYLVDWENGERSFVIAEQAKNWPNLVIDYLESNIHEDQN